MTELHALVTEMTVSVLPIDHVDRSMWSLTIAWRGGDRYAVVLGSEVLVMPEQPNTAPSWEFESRPSNRTSEFIARARFDYGTAYRLACEQAPLMTVNGMTAADVLALDEEKP